MAPNKASWARKTCDDCRSASSARLLTRRTSLSAEKEDEQDEPLRAKNRCAVDENDCDLQVATSRRPAFERAQRGIKNADSVVVVVAIHARKFLSGPVASGVKPPEVFF